MIVSSRAYEFPDVESVLELAPEPEEVLQILIVDDDAIDRKKLRRLSQSLDLSVELSETDTLAGLKLKLDMQRFDLILIDYRLGAGDGLDALSMIKGHPKNFAAATVMVSGEGDLDVAITALKAGCHDFIPKNALDVSVLRNALYDILDKTGDAALNSDGEDVDRITNAILAEISDTCFENMRPILTRCCARSAR